MKIICYLRIFVLLMHLFCIGSIETSNGQSNVKRSISDDCISDQLEHSFKTKTKGVLDRMEDNDQAVILMEEMNEELIVPGHELPADSSVNTWFTIGVNQDVFEIICIDYKTTNEAAKKVRELMEGM